ncbi:MAG: hypothetical protein JWN52_2026 [Actinomycetia bacterium]|nr:hypothetical protein [Actinomycetes bacterium]
MSDPYGAAGIRERVLAAWTASPARFREDANTEEDHALGGYRDRVIIELAQNAADAASRAGVPGRLRLILRDGVLTAANTGTPLDAAGVSALSTLRASAKIDETSSAGRFGVGFAAVISVSDEPMIVSAVTDPASVDPEATAGFSGVAWSAARTRESVTEIPSLTEELRRREGGVPVLRLPFALDSRDHPEVATVVRNCLAEGFDTIVRLPLRDAESEALVRRALDQVGPAVLLALPALGTIEIDVDGTTRTLTADRTVPSGQRESEGNTSRAGEVIINATRWRTSEAHGALEPALLADRPTEERSRPHWQICWAIPDLERPAGHAALGGPVGLPDGVPAVVHAPTPSAEPLGLPALLLASFPLAPDRRHVAPGPLTDFLIERAAEAYVELLRDLPATARLLDLVPGPVAAGELDARLRREILRRLPDAPLLPNAPAGEQPQDHDLEGHGLTAASRVRGRDAVAVDGPSALVELLAEVLPGLLPSNWPVRHQALAVLGVRRMGLADVVDALAALSREPAWWLRLYDALAGADTDALGALPVPLVPGRSAWDRDSDTVRMTRGPRGLLIAADGVDPAALAELELRFVHPGAVHPLLVRLGAIEAGPLAVLVDPAVRAAVAGSYDSDEAEPIAEAVLGLVAAAHLQPGEEPWLADLALPGVDGGRYPAGELLMPGSPLLDVMVDDAPFGVVSPELVDRFGEDPLAAVGVLRTFALVHEEDVSLSDLDLDLDGEEEWAEDVLARLPIQQVPPVVAELMAVRDLELVGRWDAALELLAQPRLRAALVEPAYVLLGDGRRVTVPSYTAWWLRRQPVVGGRRPGELRVAGDPLLNHLYDLAPPELDAEVLRALGVRTSAAELLAEPGGADELLARLADPERTVSRAQLRALWTALADLDGLDVSPAERVRAVVDGVLEVVPAADALILDSPDLLPLLEGQPLVIAPYERSIQLAELLDLALATEEISGTVESSGEERLVPPIVHEVLPEAPETYVAHDPLRVDGQQVPWRYDGVHVQVSVDAGVAALARGLAWAADRWPDRLVVEAVLRDPKALPTLLAEADLSPWAPQPPPEQAQL